MLSCCSLGSGRYPEVSGLQCLRAVHAGESRAVLGWIWQFFFGILTGESVNRQSLRKKQRRSLCRSVALPFFLSLYTYTHIFCNTLVLMYLLSTGPYLLTYVYYCICTSMAATTRRWLTPVRRCGMGGTSKSSKSLDCDLVLKPMVTWGSHIKKKNMIYLEDP